VIAAPAGNGEQKKKVPFRDETYAVVAIQKNFDPTDLDLSQNTFGVFLDDLKRQAKADANEMEGIFDKYISEQKRILEAGKLKRLARDLGASQTEGKAKQERLSREFVDAVVEQIKKEEACASNPDPKSCVGVLTADQIDYFIETIHRRVGNSTAIGPINRETLKTKSAEIAKAIAQ
jgi:hypothetical protein